MPILTRFGGGGSGDGLNFKVVQYTSMPTGTEEENTIGVVTDTVITGWVMQAEEPTASEGLVWIEVAAESNVAFYADKKRSVKLYPIAVRQYVNGVWSNRGAYIYQNGWKIFSHRVVYLYNRGDQCIDITGGWGAAGYTFASGTQVVAGTLSSDHMSMYGVNSKGVVLGTGSKINFDGFSKLDVSANILSQVQNYPSLRVSIASDKAGFTTNPIAVVYSSGKGEQVISIDLDGIDSGYVVLNVDGSTDYKSDVFTISLVP